MVVSTMVGKRRCAKIDAEPALRKDGRKRVCGSHVAVRRGRLSSATLAAQSTMRYFVPVLRLSTEMPIQSSPEDKLGGLPWGLPGSLWPACRDCGTSQSLLAQFIHHPQRLDLGRTGRLLSVFQCNHDPGMCASWEGGSGANACFVTEPEDLVARMSPLPKDSPSVEPEARIVDWVERDDGIAQEAAGNFFSSSQFDQLPRSEVRKATWSTKLGGVPRWIQSPDEAPGPGWHFVGQLDSTYSFHEAPRVQSAGIREDPERWEGRTHFCEGPNFGDGGVAYLFLRNEQGTPDGWFFWQCG
jgi:hypothetical protein